MMSIRWRTLAMFFSLNTCVFIGYGGNFIVSLILNGLLLADICKDAFHLVWQGFASQTPVTWPFCERTESNHDLSNQGNWLARFRDGGLWWDPLNHAFVCTTSVVHPTCSMQHSFIVDVRNALPHRWKHERGL